MEKISYRIKKSDITAGVLVFLLIYTYLYNPPFSFLPVGPIKFLYPIAFIYIISNRLILSFYRTFKIEIIISITILFYSLLRGVIFGDTTIYLRNNFSFLFETFVLGYFISHFHRRYLNSYKLENSIIFASFIAALISCFLIVNPSIASYVNKSLLSTDFVTNLEISMSSFRRFGLSEGLTYGYGIVQGLVLSMVLYYSLKNKWLILMVPILFISILFNARSGFIPIVLILSYIIFVKRKVASILLLIILFIVIFILFKNTSFVQSKINTFLWGADFIKQIIGLFDNSGNVSNNYLIAFLGPMFIIPDTLQGIILGEGFNIFANKKLIIHTDVGYSQQLIFGGLLYILLLFTLVFYMTKRLIKNIPMESWFSFIFILTILLLNFKGYFLWSNAASKLLFLLYTYFIVKSKDQKEEFNNYEKTPNNDNYSSL